MNRLHLQPLPSPRSAEAAGTAYLVADFVDEEVVAALVSGRRFERSAVDPTDLVLAADGDFAGWRLPGSLVADVPRAHCERPEPRRAAEPEWEPGIGEPHQGTHRWWMAGLAGALTTLLISSLLYSLSDQVTAPESDFSTIRVPVKTAPQPVVPPVTPELTGSPKVPEIR